MTEHITRTSPRRELENLDHRRRVLERALAAEPHGTRAQMNRSELQHLEEMHAAWSEEVRANREAWIAHWTRQRRVHQALARRAISELRKLQQMEEVMPAELGDTPSTNGSKAS